MKLVMFQTAGDPRLGCLHDNKVVDLNLAYEALLLDQGKTKARARAAVLVPPETIDFLEGGEEAFDEATRALDWVAARGFAPEPLRGLELVRDQGDVRLLAPVLKPEKIICAATNFWDGLKFQGKDAPSEPRIFSKFANAVCGYDDDVIKPSQTQALGYEAELAFVIGQTCRDVPEDRIFDCIAGYMTFNDISASDLTKKDKQNTRGKGFDTFAVMGPFLATRDEIPDPHDLKVKLTVNDRVLQDSNTDQLVFDVPALLSFCSRIFTLEPGDVIATGSPQGLAGHYDPPAFLKPGDMMVTEIERLGVCRNRIIDGD